MPNIFKNASLNPALAGLDVLYTVPAATNSIVMSALATSTNGQSNTASIGVVPAGSSTINFLTRNVNVPNGSSVNLLAGKVSLNAGDRLIANNNDAGLSDRLNAGGGHTYASEPINLLSNADGSIVCAYHATGISTSTDGGVTSTLRLSEAFGTGYRPGMFFGGAFWFYVSATSARRSTDGVTWTTVAVTNAPENRCTALGSIIQKGGQAWGVFGLNRLTMTTDGTTWTPQGVAMPGSATNGLAWTGTNWLASQSTLNGDVYLSTTGAAWTTVASGAGAVAAAMGGIAALGGSVLINYQGAYRQSSDHGATWAASVSTGAASTQVVATPSTFLICQSNPTVITSRPGFPLVLTNSFFDEIGSTSTMTLPFVIAGTRLITARHATADLALTRRGGMTVTASVVEVS